MILSRRGQRLRRLGMLGAGKLPFFKAAAASLRPNAVAFWDLASNSTDQTGNGHNGSDTSVTYDGTFASYTGSTSQTNLTAITLGTTFTWSCWVKCANYSGTYLGTMADDNIGVYVLNKQIDLFFSGADHGSTGTMTNGALTHLVVSVAAGTASFYVNGVARATAAGWPGGSIKYLGNDNVGDMLNGQMRCAGVFSDAKNSAWITSVFNSGVPLKWAGM